MSLLLLWENPLNTFNPRSSRVVISRKASAQQPTPAVTITTDATWGFFEDVENDDPAAVYEIRYQRDRESQVEETIRDAEITRYVRQPDQAIFTFQKHNFTGAPDAGRGIDISDYDSSAGAHSFRILTNHAGVARFPLKQGARVRIHIDDEYNALDTIVPAQQDVSWAELISSGSWVLADRRGIY